MSEHKHKDRAPQPRPVQMEYLRVNLENGESVTALMSVWISCLISSLPPVEFEAVLKKVQAASLSPSLVLPGKGLAQAVGRSD